MSVGLPLHNEIWKSKLTLHAYLKRNTTLVMCLRGGLACQSKTDLGFVNVFKPEKFCISQYKDRRIYDIM